MFYPSSKNEDSTLLKVSTKDVDYKEKNCRTKKPGYDNSLCSLEVDKDFYRMNYKKLDEKKLFFSVSENSLGSKSTIVSSTISIINPSFAFPIACSSALITSLATLIMNEGVSELKTR